MENESIKGLKGLKSLQATDLQKISDNIRNSVVNAPKQYGQVGFNPTPVQSNTGNFGESRFDPKIANADQFQDINNARGENQPWYAQLAAGSAKMGVLAGTTFLNSTVGLVAGAATAIAEGRWSGLWDNGVNKFLYNINKKSEEFLPNYYTNEEKDSPWYENIFTANFIGDKVLKNMGFTMGAIAAGALTGNFGTSLLANAGKAGSIASRILATGVSAAGEASIEALNASNDFIGMNAQAIDKSVGVEKGALDDKYAGYISAIEAKYSKGGNTIIPTGEGGGFTDRKTLEIKALEEQYHKELKGVQDKRELLLAEANEDKLKVGNTTFGLNMALLSATNNAQFARELAGGFKNAKRAKALTATSVATGEKIQGTKAVGEALLKGDLRFEANKGVNAAIAKNVVKNIGSEEFEEGAQNIAANASQIKYSADLNTFAGAKINPYVQEDVNDLLSATGQAILDQFGTAESAGWEEVFLGGISVAIGVPFLKRTKGGVRPTWAGGVSEASKAAKDDFRANEVVDRINANIQKPEFVTRYQGLIRHQNYQQKMDDALQSGDEFNYENHETSQLISDSLMFREVGALDSYKDFVKSFQQTEDLSEEQLKSLKENTTSETTGKSIYDGMDKHEIKDAINKNSEKTIKTIDQVMKIHDIHTINYSDIFNKDELEELTFLQTKSMDWGDRAQQKYKELQETLTPIFEGVGITEVKNSKGEIINPLELLKTSPQQFITELSIPQSDLQKALVESAADVQALTKQIVSLNESLLAKSTFGMQYHKAIQDPDSLKKVIAKDIENSVKEETKVKVQKNVDKLRVATNIAQLKKNSVGFSQTERSQALDELAKEDSFVGKLAQELSKMDKLHMSLGSLLNNSEYEDYSDEEKDSARQSIDAAFSASQKASEMSERLEGDALANPILQDMLRVKRESDEENATYRDEEASTPTIPAKPTVIKPEIDLDEETEGETEETIEEIPTATEEEIPTVPEVNTSIDASFLNEEDYIRVTSGLTESGIQDVSENPIKYTETIRAIYTAIESGLSDKEIAVKYLGNVDNLEDSTYKEAIDKLRDYFKGAKERAAIMAANESSKDNPDSLSELNTALETLAGLIDNKNDRSKSGEIRSDGISEANIELLMPHGKGMSKGGKRFFKSLHSEGTENGGAYDFYWDYMNSSGAFNFINSGKLADLVDKNENTKVHFIVDKTLNSYEREGATPLASVILMAVEADTPTAITIGEKKYQIVGSLKANNAYIKGLQEKVLMQSKESSEEMFISPDYSEVDYIYPGRIATSKVGSKEQEKDVINSGKSLLFGVFRGKRIFAPNVPEGKIVDPTTEDNKNGRVYLMLKAADGRYYPTPVRRKAFTMEDYPQETYGNTPVYKAITTALETLADPTSNDDARYFARDMFEKFIYFGNKVKAARIGDSVFRLKWQKDKLIGEQWIQISRETGIDENGKKIYQTVQKDGKNYAVRLTNDKEANKTALLELVQYMEPMFQINYHLLENEQYVDMLVASGVFTTNLADYTLHNAMFTIKPMDSDGKPIQSEIPTERPTSTKVNAVGTIDTFDKVLDKNGKEYRLYPNGDILDVEGVKVTKPMTRAYVYAKNALAKGNTLNKLQYGEDTFYIMNMGTGEYAVQVQEGNIVDIISGDKYLKLRKDHVKYVASQEQAKAVAEALKAAKNNGETSIADLRLNGYNPSKYVTEVSQKGREVLVYSGNILNKASRQLITTIIIPVEYVDQLIALEKKFPNYTEEEMNAAAASIYTEVINNTKFKEEETDTSSKSEEQDTFNSISANQNPLADNKGFVVATNMEQIVWDTSNKSGVNSKAKAIEAMKKAIKKKYSKASEPEVVTKSEIPAKPNTTAPVSNPLINPLVNNLQNEKNLPKDLHMSEEIHIFANHSVEELKRLRDALKSKGITARTKSQIAQEIMTLLGLNETEILALDDDALIGKINCK